jgi:hypothetical protein
LVRGLPGRAREAGVDASPRDDLKIAAFRHP